MHSDNNTNLQIIADSENLDAMLDFVNNQAILAGLTEQDLFDIRLGCEEVLANIINYAYPEAKGSINICCKWGVVDKRLELHISDQGIAFNPLATPEPDIQSPFEDRTIGGLGIFIVRKVFNSVTYTRSDRTNTLTLIKK